MDQFSMFYKMDHVSVFYNEVSLVQSSKVMEKECYKHDIDGSVQERRNSIANALELCLSCIKPLI